MNPAPTHFLSASHLSLFTCVVVFFFSWSYRSWSDGHLVSGSECCNGFLDLQVPRLQQIPAPFSKIPLRFSFNSIPLATRHLFDSLTKISICNPWILSPCLVWFGLGSGYITGLVQSGIHGKTAIQNVVVFDIFSMVTRTYSFGVCLIWFREERKLSCCEIWWKGCPTFERERAQGSAVDY